MDGTKLPAFSAFVIGIVLLSQHVDNSLAFEKPVVSGIVVLACAGASILGSTCLQFNGIAQKRSTFAAYELSSQDKKNEDVERPQQDPALANNDAYPASLRAIRLTFMACVVSICSRLVLHYLVFANIQCSQHSLAPLIPIAFAVLDFWYTPPQKNTSSDYDLDVMLHDTIGQWLFGARSSSLLATVATSVGSWLLLRLMRNPASTYICAASLGHHLTIPWLQILGTGLDIAILLLIKRLITQEQGRGKRTIRLRLASAGWACLYSAGIISMTYLILSTTQLYDYHSVARVSGRYMWNLFQVSCYCSLIALGGVYTINNTGITTTSILATFIFVTSSATSAAWHRLHPYPVTDWGSAYLLLGTSVLGVLMYLHIDTTYPNPGRSSSLFTTIPSSVPLTLLCLFLWWTGLLSAAGYLVDYHPVTMLMYDAQHEFTDYLNKTSSTGHLKDTVAYYRHRYHMPPPPDFDIWFQYAIEREAVIVNEYDSIHDDLLPFRALSPAQIRDRTLQLIMDPHNNVTGLRIRNGVVTLLSDGTAATSMETDLVSMISAFSRWLPDMDMAFNLADTCAVATPYRKLRSMKQKAEGIIIPKRLINVFSSHRAQQWIETVNTSSETVSMSVATAQHTFQDSGSIGCSPGSHARSSFPWDLSKLCLRCAQPHSLGLFVSNWTKSLDPCYQPDLVHLHGLYSGRRDARVMQDLYPLFSPFKDGTCNDILYPSTTSYRQSSATKSMVTSADPPFPEKESSLFWRGSALEGYSADHGEWRGMTAQRLAHVAHNINNSAPAQALLLPQSRTSLFKAEKLTYLDVPVSKLSELLATDVHYVNGFTGCGERDCADQAREFAPLAKPVTADAHWNYKYLLDVDGVGPSEQFFSFLRSRSLPFKATLNREWWMSRVAPWVHFVPLDIRGHGLWATLAYFQGVDGKMNGKNVKVDGRQRDAERIAEQGRLWAGKVLRKEDMEIHMFRLLLEWGRLTDDRRDELGFVGE